MLSAPPSAASPSRRGGHSKQRLLGEVVTSADVIREWTRNLNHDRVIPLVALDAHRIVAEGAMVRRQGAARSQIAEIRLAVAPTWRNRGVGTQLIRSLCEIATEAGFAAVLLELVEDCEAEPVKSAEEIGFVCVGRLEGGARDRDAHPHYLVTLAMPLGQLWSRL